MKCTRWDRFLGVVLAVMMLLGVPCQSAAADTGTIQTEVGELFYVNISLDGNSKVFAEEMTISYIFASMNSSANFKIELNQLSFPSGCTGTLQDGTIRLTSSSGMFSGMLCTASFLLKEHNLAEDTILFTYKAVVKDIEACSGIRTIIVGEGGAVRTEAPTPVVTSVPAPTAEPVRVGGTMTFGSYEQDNVWSNGKEDIVWRVLAVEGDRALLISEKVLDQQVYHPSQSAVTWESCFLRQWLNHDFYNEAFDSGEQQRILEVTVPAHHSPYYDDMESSRKSVGEATRDKVFLLSAQEANGYFAGNWDRLAYATPYAIFQGVSAETTTEACSWLLRQPHKHRTNTACVNYMGSPADGVNVSHDREGIRPALWIKLN